MQKIDVAKAKTAFNDRKTLIGICTYLFFFLPRMTEYKADRELQYHMRQAIGLLVFALMLQGIISILGYWGMPSWRVWPVRIILVYLFYTGALNVLGSQLKPLPWIGKYAERIF